MWPWDREIFPLSLYPCQSQENQAPSLQRSTPLVWLEVGCVAALSFLGWFCTDDVQNTVRDSLHLRQKFHSKKIYLFIFFVTPATSFVQICTSLSGSCRTVDSHGVSSARIGLYLLSSLACIPLCCVSFFHFSRLMLSLQGCISLHYITVLEL